MSRRCVSGVSLAYAVPLVLALALLLTACGGGSEQIDGTTLSKPPETATDTSTATATDADPREPRTVTHEFGETQVPTDPQRVVVLDNEAILGTALLCDVPVVATNFQPFGDGFLPYFPAEEFADMEDVGWTEIDIEKIAAIDPDLIVGDTGAIGVGEIGYDLLEQIAPTVIFEHFGFTPWKDAIREAAAVFGCADEIDRRIAEYEARVDELRDALGDRVDELSFSLANFLALDDIRIYTSDWCSARILEEVDFGRPPNQQDLDEAQELSIERLPAVDADVLFYFVGSTATDPEEADDAAAAITSHPLWDNLGAVQAGRAYEVAVPHWFTCSSLQAAQLVLDDLFELLVDDGGGS